MKRVLKKAVGCFLTFCILSSCILWVVPANAQNSMTSNKMPKHISIVYDDSGSMVNGDDPANKNTKKIKRWAQAKYSLEAFVSMLDTEDELEIFTLNHGKYGKTIIGRDKEKAVKDIHNNFKTGDCSATTPDTQVKKAGDNLVSHYKNAERWLVVITDGNFDGYGEGAKAVNKTENLLSKYGKKLNGNVIFIPICTGNTYKESNFYCLPAENGEEILTSVQDAIGKVYKSSRNAVGTVEVKQEEGSYYATVNTGGVSMTQLIVFAQGKGATVTGTDNDQAKANNIGVKYTETENAVKYSGAGGFKNHPSSIITDKSLEGVVSTIVAKEEAIVTNEAKAIKVYLGKTEPKQVTVYYEPYVSVDYSLSSGETKVLDANSGKKPCVSPGDYKFKADVVDAVTNERIPDGLQPQMNVGIQGGKYGLEELREGVDITLDKNFNGETDFNADANIIEGRYSLNTDGMVGAFKNLIVKETYFLKVDFQKPTAKTLNFRFRKTNFILGSLGKLSTDRKKHSIKGVVRCLDSDGKEVKLTDAQWKAVQNAYESGNSGDDYFFVGTPEGNSTRVDYSAVEFEPELNDGKGVFYLVPKYYKNPKNGKISKKKTTHKNFIHRSDKNLCTIACDITLPNVSDELAYSTTATPYEEKSDKYEISISAWYTIAIILFIIWMLGYFLKGHLPSIFINNKYRKGLVKNIDAKENFSGNLTDPFEWKKAAKDKDSRMKIKRAWWSVLLPYIPQQGKLGIGNNAFNNRLRLKVRSTSIMGDEFAIINSSNSFSPFKKKSTMGSSDLTFKAGSTITKDDLKKAKKDFRFFAYLKRYPKQMLVRCKSASFTYGGYKGEQKKIYKAVLGEKPENIKKAKAKAKGKTKTKKKK